MNTCRFCGSTLRPELAWCPQCRIPVAPSSSKSEQPGDTEPESQDQPTHKTVPRGEFLGINPEAKVVPVYSRWRSGPNSFGPVTKVVATTFILALFPFGGAQGMKALYFIIYSPFALLCLWGLWRKERVS